MNPTKTQRISQKKAKVLQEPEDGRSAVECWLLERLPEGIVPAQDQAGQDRQHQSRLTNGFQKEEKVQYEGERRGCWEWKGDQEIQKNK